MKVGISINVLFIDSVPRQKKAFMYLIGFPYCFLQHTQRSYWNYSGPLSRIGQTFMKKSHAWILYLLPERCFFIAGCFLKLKTGWGLLSPSLNKQSPYLNTGFKSTSFKSLYIGVITRDAVVRFPCGKGVWWGLAAGRSSDNKRPSCTVPRVCSGTPPETICVPASRQTRQKSPGISSGEGLPLPGLYLWSPLPPCYGIQRFPAACFGSGFGNSWQDACLAVVPRAPA